MKVISDLMTLVGGTIRRAGDGPASAGGHDASRRLPLRHPWAWVAASAVETLRELRIDLERRGPAAGTRSGPAGSGSPEGRRRQRPEAAAGRPDPGPCRADWRRPGAYWACTKAAGHPGRHRMRPATPPSPPAAPAPSPPPTAGS